MIQKYTCIPLYEYDVLIVTNGTVSQVERALVHLNEKTNNEVPANSNIIYLDTFNDMITHLNLNEDVDPNSQTRNYRGKSIFMFFNGVAYVQNFLCEIIDHYSRLLHNATHNYNKFSFVKLHNSYFYFDSTIVSSLEGSVLETCLDDSYQLNSLVCIANDILKKISFMLYRIRGVFLDDFNLHGECTFSVLGLLRNFPKIERVEHSRSTPILLRDLVI